MDGHASALDKLIVLIFVGSDADVAIKQHLKACYMILLHLEVHDVFEQVRLNGEANIN